jgi:hypothetical protein
MFANRSDKGYSLKKNNRDFYVETFNMRIIYGLYTLYTEGGKL